MKERLIVIFTATACSMASVFTTDLVAQENKAFGLKGGLNLSYLTLEEADDNNIVPGFHAGVWASRRIAGDFTIQPEVHYSLKGTRTVYDAEFLGFDVADGNTRLNLHYIDIPVYLNYYLSRDFRFYLGPYFGVLLSAKMDTDAEVLEFINVDDVEEIDREEFTPLDIGVSGGLGFTFDPVVVGFNYNLGLRQVAAEDGPLEALLGEAKNAVIQVYIGISF